MCYHTIVLYLQQRLLTPPDVGIISREKNDNKEELDMSNTNQKTSVLSIKSLTLLGLLTAIVMLFSFTPIGSIPIGPLVITLNVIPIAIAAIALGPFGGAVIGGVFGLMSFLQCVGIGVPSAMGEILFNIDPFLAFVQRFIPRLLDGFLVGLLFMLLSKIGNKYAACCITGFLTAFLNTAFFMSALVLLFGNTEYMKRTMDGKSFLPFVVSFVGVNAIVEMAAATIISGAVGFALIKAGFVKIKK